MLLNELHPDDHARLLARYRGDSRIKVTQIDALACVKSSLPPPERRGLVLIDPPYELKDEAQRSMTMLQEGLRRFASGIFMLWYPLKADDTARTIRDSAQALGCPATLQVELRIREAFSGGGLAGSGLVIANTPWQLDAEMNAIASALAQRLGLGDWGQATVRVAGAPGLIVTQLAVEMAAARSLYSSQAVPQRVPISFSSIIARSTRPAAT